jgi:hypothetical protein
MSRIGAEKLILQWLQVPIGPDIDQWHRRHQMDAVIKRSWRGQACGLDEDIRKLSYQDLQMVVGGESKRLHVRSGQPDPPDSMVKPLKHHGEAREVPDNGPEGA